MYRLSPSILAADFGRLADEIANVEKAGASYLHFDVMDGHFVPSMSFGMPVLKAVRTRTALKLDVHLMIEEPDRYLKEFRESGADIITVHAEAARHLHRTVERIHELGAAAGVALNPSTPLCALDYILPDVDMVPERGLSFDIEIDGGIRASNVGDAIRAGANVIVAGTAVFCGNIQKNVKDFHRIFEECRKELTL